jgi:hypothetical protein
MHWTHKDKLHPDWIGRCLRTPRSENSAKKSGVCDESLVPVPQTDTGGGVENTKGREITLSKELGKMAP